MSKSTIVIIVYIIGLIFGALVLGLWDANTTLIKAAIAMGWTATFLIALFYAEKKENH